MNQPFAKPRTILLTGIITTVPLVATIVSVRFLFERIDGLLGPFISQHIGREIPGLGLAATTIIIAVMGLVASNVVGRRLLSVGESLVNRLPLVRAVYRTSKDIIGVLAAAKAPSLRDVVMIEYPLEGTYAYGFLTSYTKRTTQDGVESLGNVYLPSPPVPTSGVLVAVPVEKIVFLDLSGEEAMKLIISGGLAAPAELRQQPR